jgi:hypothetical protein
MLTLDSRILARANVLSTELDGALVLMSMASGSYFSLEAVGHEIWQAVAAPIRVRELCARLVETYDAPEDRIRANVLAFLDQLRAHDLIAVE